MSIRSYALATASVLVLSGGAAVAETTQINAGTAVRAETPLDTPETVKGDIRDTDTQRYDVDAKVKGEIKKEAQSASDINDKLKTNTEQFVEDADAKKETPNYKADIDADIDVKKEPGDAAQAPKNKPAQLGDAAPAAGGAADSALTIEQLPDSGVVKLSGTVATVTDGNRFTLRDSNSDVIDVHTSSTISVKEGDKVTVTGQVDDEIMGIGEQITSAKVSVNN